MDAEGSETSRFLYITSPFSGSDADTHSTTSLPHQCASPARLTTKFRRPSFIAGGGRPLLLNTSSIPEFLLRDDELLDLIRQERSLLITNRIEVPRHQQTPIATEIEDEWEEAVKEGKIKTTARYELLIIARYCVLSSLSIVWG